MTIRCRIITPYGVYRELDASIVNIVTSEGEQRGILPNHMPIVTMMKISKMTTEESDGRHEYAVSGGLFYFRDNVAEILADAVESKEEIDVERALYAKERAERRLARNDPNMDLARAQVALQKALNRLTVSGRNL